MAKRNTHAEGINPANHQNKIYKKIEVINPSGSPVF